MNKQINHSVLIALALLSVGCRVGMAPSGMDQNDAKAAIAGMTPEQRIKAIASSPLPAAEKQKQYAEIEQQSGVKASTVLGTPNVPGSG